jgi:hypothetical protein
MDPIANASRITSTNRVLHTDYEQEKQGNPSGTLMLARSEMLPQEVWNKTLKKGTKNISYNRGVELLAIIFQHGKHS